MTGQFCFIYLLRYLQPKVQYNDLLRLSYQIIMKPSTTCPSSPTFRPDPSTSSSLPAASKPPLPNCSQFHPKPIQPSDSSTSSQHHQDNLPRLETDTGSQPVFSLRTREKKATKSGVVGTPCDPTDQPTDRKTGRLMLLRLPNQSSNQSLLCYTNLQTERGPQVCRHAR